MARSDEQAGDDVVDILDEDNSVGPFRLHEPPRGLGDLLAQDRGRYQVAARSRHAGPEDGVVYR